MSAIDTTTYLRPKVTRATHPVETTRYLLGTNEINCFYDTVCQWIENRSPGGMIYGKPRLGKTRAILYLSKLLPDKFSSSLPIISLSCRDYRIASESIFFEDLLRTAGHSIVKRGNSSAKRDRLLEFLYEKVELTGQDRLILFIDEAQKLHEIQYKWLIDLHNELDRLSKNLIVLLVGQPDLEHQYSAFLHTGKSQIIGRFMTHQHEFRGLREVEDILVCLNGYDEVSEYPEKSGCSFTRYFYPTAFSLGWRLAHESETLWNAFLETWEKYGFVGRVEIPMQYFCRTIEYVLKRHSSLKDPHPNLSMRIWKEAILCSGFVEAEDRYAAPKSA